MREQGERLEHHTGRPLVGRHVVDTSLAQEDVTRGRRIHAGQHADQRCLPLPDGPTMVKNSLSAILRSMPSTAVKAPKSLRRAFSVRMVGRWGVTWLLPTGWSRSGSLPHNQGHAEGCYLNAVSGTWTTSIQPPVSPSSPRSRCRAACRSRGRYRTRPSPPSLHPGCPTEWLRVHPW